MAYNVRVPHTYEIAALSRWAKVALAARYARRVEPLLTRVWPGVKPEFVATICQAIELGEHSAATATCACSATRIARAAREVSYAICAKEAWNKDIQRSVASAISFVASRVAAAAAATNLPDPVRAAAETTRAAAEAAGAAAGVIRDLTIFNDFRTIAARARAEQWTDNTSVPPWVFGPMWPNGVPEGWPKADPAERLVVTVAPPPEAPAAEIADIQNRLYAALNKLVIANGGAGLTIDTIQRDVPIMVPAGTEV